MPQYMLLIYGPAEGGPSPEQLAAEMPKWFEYTESLKRAGTILWNGPVGVFEFDQFAGGTKTLAQAIAASKAFSIAGGGDTVAAINKFGVAKDIGYISTAGGAFLEFLEGKKLPAVEVLEARAAG